MWEMEEGIRIEKRNYCYWDFNSRIVEESSGCEIRPTTAAEYQKDC